MSSRRDLWIHLMLYPGHTLPTAAAPILIGAGLAIHDGVFAAVPVLLAFLASWMVHVGGVFVDVERLLARWPNLREHPELDDAVATGALRLPALRLASVAWFVGAFVPGAFLYLRLGPSSLALGAIGIVAATWYAAGRPSMAELGLADPIFFLMFGVVAVAATYFVQARPVPLAAYLVGLPSAGMVTNVLVIDDIRDRTFDLRKGWRTTAVRFGVGGSRALHLAFTIASYLGVLALAARYGAWLLLPLVTLPLAIVVERRVWTAPDRETLIPWTPRSALLGLVFSALVALGLALS